jgi:hypothetical protein
VKPVFQWIISAFLVYVASECTQISSHLLIAVTVNNFVSSDELKGLGQTIDASGDQLRLVKVFAEDVSATVDNVHTDALKIYTDIDSLTIPEINIPKLKEVAEFTAQEVGSLVNASVFST